MFAAMNGAHPEIGDGAYFGELSSSPQEHSQESDQSTKESGDRSRKAKILIVEDEKLVAEHLKEIVEEEGYKVVGLASSGEEAIAIFTAKDPDLILMDVNLAGKMDGIQTAIVIHYTMKPVRILFLTAHSQEKFPHLGAINPPLYKYIRKPYQAQVVTDAVQQLLKGK